VALPLAILENFFHHWGQLPEENPLKQDFAISRLLKLSLHPGFYI